MIINADIWGAFCLISEQHKAAHHLCLCSTLSWTFLGSTLKQEKEIKCIQIGKEAMKLSLFEYDIIFYGDLKEFIAMYYN